MYFLYKFFPNNGMLRKMTDRISRDYSHSNNTSYNAGIFIPSGRQGPPPPMLTQFDQNLQSKHVVHSRGQYSEEKNIVSHSPYPESLNGQRPMTIVSPTYDQHIIKPPIENVTHGRIHDTEIICSEDRDYTLYPNPSNYIIKLKDIYKNVTSVTLFNASIPNTAYLIDERNNLIYFRETSCDKMVAEIPCGDYKCALKLAEAISIAMTNVSIAMNSPGNHSTYTTTVDELKNKICISSNLIGGDHIFSLCFYGCSEPHDGRKRAIYPPRSIGRVLGFPRQDFLYAYGKANLSSGRNIVIGNEKTCFTTDFKEQDIFYVEECDQIFTVIFIENDNEMTIDPPAPCNASCVLLAKGKHIAPNKYDLSSDAFLILNILELENIRSNSTFVDRAYAVIPMIFPHNTKNFVVSPSGGVPPYVKYFNPPLARLDRLTICFKDKDGNIVNFNGIENFMEFRIHTLNANGKYEPGL